MMLYGCVLLVTPVKKDVLEVLKSLKSLKKHVTLLLMLVTWLLLTKTGLFVIKTGHGVPINDATKALRSKIGLSELPATTHSFPEALEEVQKYVKSLLLMN